MAQKDVKSVSRSWVKSDIKLTGKTVLITGANTGIGLETAIDLAKREAKTIIACRDLMKGEVARERIVKESGSRNVLLKQLDLASLESVRNLAHNIRETEDRLDVLINNAGVRMCAESETADGFETHFGVNHLGHFLLTNLLLDLIQRSAPSRIITVSSSAHRFAVVNWEDLNKKKDYTPIGAYQQSKLMNILFSRELSRRLKGTGVTSNCLHPGVVDTSLGSREVSTAATLSERMVLMGFKMKFLLKTPQHGAQTSIFCAMAPELEGVSGKYFSGCKVTGESRSAMDDRSAKRLWDISEQLTGLQVDCPI